MRTLSAPGVPLDSAPRTAPKRFATRRAAESFLWTVALSAAVAATLAWQVVQARNDPALGEPTLGFLLSWALTGATVGLLLGSINALLAGFVSSRRVHAVVVLLSIAGAVHALREGAREPATTASYPTAGVLETSGVPATGPDLVLVTVDTLRHDHLGFAGYDRPVSPSLDALAARGRVFEGIAQAPATRSSMASLMVGLYPHVVEHERHRRGEGEDGAFVADGFHLLAERLRAGGYETAAFVTNPHLRADNGFGQGFDHFDETALFGYGSEGRRRDADDAVDLALKWLSERSSSKPFFLWLHLLDPHHPYEPREAGPWEDPTSPDFAELDAEYRGWSVEAITEHLQGLSSGARSFREGELDYLVGRYDAEIRQTDRALGRLVDALDRSPRGLDDTLVIVTADHGEEFMDHGGLLHSHTLYDELVRVPFVVSGPGFPSGEDGGLARLIDVAPTLLHAASLPTPGLAGRALQAPTAEEPTALSFRSLAEVSFRAGSSKLFTRYSTPSMACRSGHAWRDLRDLFAARYGRGRRALGDQTRLFDLATDPRELSPVVDRSRLHPLLCRLEETWEEHPVLVLERTETPGLDAQARKTLEALGYVG